MTTFKLRRPLRSSPAQTFAWHGRRGAISRLSPAWGPGRVIEPAPLENGAIAKLSVSIGPASVDWIAEHQDVIEGEQFVDVQRQGPFKRWRHTHRFLAVEGDAGVDDGIQCILEDDIDYAVPLGFLGAQVAGRSIAKDLERLFHWRHDVTDGDLRARVDLTDALGGGKALTIGVTGASGLVGSALAAYLDAQGHTVVRIERARPEPGATWSRFVGLEALEGADAVVHLAGESLMGRWDEAKRVRIMDSRATATSALIEDLRALRDPPTRFLCASAVGIYGDRADTVLDETAEGGDGFLADVVRAWEDATTAAAQAGWRVVNLRFGVIFDGGGGALPLMALPVRLGAGGPLGKGTQYLAAIALDDVLDIVLRTLVDDRVEGPINVVAPEVERQKDVASILGNVLHRPSFMPAPKFALRVAVGQSADEMLFASQRVQPAKLLALGHTFRMPSVEEMVRHALGVARG